MFFGAPVSDEYILNAVSDAVVFVRKGRIAAFNRAFSELIGGSLEGEAVENVFERQFVERYITKADEGAAEFSFNAEPWGDYEIDGSVGRVKDATVVIFRICQNGTLPNTAKMNFGLQSQLRVAMSSLLASVKTYGTEPSGSGMAAVIHGICRTLNYSSGLLSLLSGVSDDTEECYCDPAGAFEEVIAVAQRLISAAGYRMNASCDCSGGSVRMGKQNFDRIVLTLVADALERCGKDGGIELSLVSVDAEKPYVMLTVEDAGGPLSEQSRMVHQALAGRFSVSTATVRECGSEKNVISVRLPLCDAPEFESSCVSADEGIPEIYILLSEILPDDAYEALLQ